MRCNECQACREVNRMREQALRVLAHASVYGRTGCGEDVRLVWNRTLAENPCEVAPQAPSNGNVSVKGDRQ